MRVKPAVVFFLFLILIQQVHSGDLKYAITGPKEARVGEDYAFTVFIEGEKSVTVTIKATLHEIPHGTSQRGDVVAEQDVTISYGVTNFLKLNIPLETAAGVYYFEVWCHSFHSHKTIEVTITKKAQSIFIQTDKGIYKPGQEVKFRTISVNSDLKPYKEEINITIFDKSQNRIKRLTNMRNDFGVITDSLKLSDQTPLGIWKIEAKTKFQTETETFEVSEYVLPKFEVKVENPSVLFLNNRNPMEQEPLLISATAFYTYGQPVNGIAKIRTKLEKVEGIRSVLDYANVIHIDLVKGRADLTLDYQELIQQHPVMNRYLTREMTLKVEVTVLETVTGEERTASSSVVLKQDRLKIEFLPNTPKNFKPGLQYQGSVSITKIDSSKLSANELKKSNGDFESVILTFDIEGFTKFEFLVNKNGIASFDVPIPLDIEKFSVEASFLVNSPENVTTTIEVEKFATKHRGGIQIRLQNTKLVIKPNENLRFKVETVEETKRVTLQIMAKGVLVESKEETKETATKEHYFEVSVNASLSLKLAPEAIFIVSYVSGEGELIADSLTLNVEDYMSNKVSLSFSKNETKPGDREVVLTVKTSDSSYIGLLGVDQSVLLLNEGNDLTAEKLEKELDSYRTKIDSEDKKARLDWRRRSIMFCLPPLIRWSNEKNSQKILKKSGLEILTNFLFHETERNVFYTSQWNGDRLYMNNVGYGSPMGAPGFNSRSNHRNFGPGGADQRPSTPAVVVRKKFPETFIWSDFITDQNGDYQLKVSIPDTITSWSTTAFSLNSQLGLALTQNPAKITVIKNFFVSLKLPYSVIKGEQFQLHVTVFNYNDQDLETEVKLAASTSFKVIDCERGQVTGQDVIKSVIVTKNNAKAVTFWLEATSLDHMPMQVTATSAVAADAMRTQVLVKPEGKPESYSVSFLMHLSSGEEFHKTIDIEVPSQEQLVEGSIRAQVTLIGDVMGTSMNGIEDLLHMPSGCAEQNLVHLAPDVYLLKYLSLTNQSTPAFEKKALAFINSGYQKQLTYQRNDGSFSAFGNSDQAGSVWLSAFTIKCLHQAKDFIPVEDKYLAQTINWIIRTQDSSGKFSEPYGAKIWDSKMQGGASSGHALTAYTLIALIENQDNSDVDAEKLKESISKAQSYLENNHQENLSNAYNLAIVSYALFKSNSTHLEVLITALNQLASQKDDMKYWQNTADTSSDAWTCAHTRATSYSIELASYMLALHSQQNNIGEALSIAKWLLTQRNAFGGFSSTQDTVLALEALTSFASLFDSSTEKGSMQLSVTHSTGTHSFNPIHHDNALILQSYHLPRGSERVLFGGSGSGVAVVQLNVNYNVKVAHKNNFLSLTLNSQQEANNVVLDITTSWSGNEVSGMVMVEVSLLTGHSVVQEEHTKRMIGHSFKKMEKSDDKVFFYLEELTSSALTIRVYMTETLKVANVKPAYVKVYRYYDTQHMATSFYSSHSDQSSQSSCAR